MSIALIVVAGIALGRYVPRWGLVLLPLVVGGVALGLVLRLGAPADRDTPIAFVALAVALAIALGVLTGRRRLRTG